MLTDEQLDTFEAEAASEPDPNKMRRASLMAARMAWLEQQKQRIEQTLDVLNSKLHHYRTVTVPEALAEAGQVGFTLDGGITVADQNFAGVSVAVDDFVAGTLPKDPTKRGEAIAYLEANDAGTLLKDTLLVEVPKAKQNDVHRIMDWLRSEGYSVERTSTVHPQTLLAWARERLRKGKETEFERIGVFVGRMAKLKWPKVKAGY